MGYDYVRVGNMIRTSGRAFPRAVPLRAVKALLDMLRDIGGDPEQALAQAGLSHLRLLIEAGGEADVPRVAFARLSRICVVAIHVHACRTEGLRPLPFDYFKLMCTALLSCPDLKTAIATAAAYERIMLEHRGQLRLTVAAGIATLAIDLGNRKPSAGAMLVEVYALAAFHRLFSWLTHDEVILEEVLLSFPSALVQPALIALLPLEPRFDQQMSGLRFSSRYLDLPVNRTYGDLNDLFGTFPFDLLPPDYEQRTLAQRVRDAIMAALDRGDRLPDMARLASLFAMSVPTFRRRLAQEGSSLGAIREACRCDRARHLLLGTELTVKQIAFRAGFADTASFRRAFRGWTGLSPQAYRDHGNSRPPEGEVLSAVVGDASD